MKMGLRNTYLGGYDGLESIFYLEDGWLYTLGNFTIKTIGSFRLCYFLFIGEN